MGRLKVAELVISTISALVSIAKYIVKVIDYIGKFNSRPAIRAT